MRIENAFRAAAFGAVLALAACATAGTPFDTAHVGDVRKGVQDRTQIRAWFGEPHQVQAVSGSPLGCIERWTYTHAYSSYGGAKTKTETLVVDFNPSGKVCDSAYVEQ